MQCQWHLVLISYHLQSIRHGPSQELRAAGPCCLGSLRAQGVGVKAFSAITGHQEDCSQNRPKRGTKHPKISKMWNKQPELTSNHFKPIGPHSTPTAQKTCPNKIPPSLGHHDLFSYAHFRQDVGLAASDFEPNKHPPPTTCNLLKKSCVFSHIWIQIIVTSLFPCELSTYFISWWPTCFFVLNFDG